MPSIKSKAVIIFLLTACLNYANISFAKAPATAESYDAIKWYRVSAERFAQYRQVFLTAGNVIQQKVKVANLQPHEWGVIFDIDETILDNSQWNYENDVLGKKQEWDAFAAKGISLDTPGAKELINRIHDMGGYVDMVTNRKLALKSATEKNLRDKGLYFDQILFYTGHSKDWYPDKNSRFQAIIDGKSPAIMPAHKVIAWLGDNIQDMPGIKQSDLIKQDPYGSAYNKFGITYFSLPNPMYGSWETNQLH